MPKHYLKPPLHTYLNHLLVLGPTKQILGGWFRIDRQHHWPIYLLGSRLLTIALFCGFLATTYLTVRSTAGVEAAFIITLILSTSAGILVFNRFLTADSPLLFWMAASMAFAVRSGIRQSTPDAVVAAILAGLAAANKYNGLGVAAAIPAALFAAHGWRFILRPAPWLAGLAVPIGFFLGCPGALIDTRRFIDDFTYNYLTTPVYDGTTQGTGYLKFFSCFPDLIGWPASIILGALLVATVYWCFRAQIHQREWILLASCTAVFVLYFLMIGKFPRMGTRFVLPSIPFILLLAAPAIARINWKNWIAKSILTTVVCYNVYASIDAGLRFTNDPRMKALKWVQKNAPEGASFENSYAPDWRRIAGRKYRVEQMPAATGRSQLFTKIIGKQKTIQNGLDRFESKYGNNTFTIEGLESRKPDFIAFTTQVFEWSGDDDAQRFYAALDREDCGYKKVYEETARQRWPFSYPLRIDFIADRIVIMAQKGI